MVGNAIISWMGMILFRVMAALIRGIREYE